MLPSLSLWAGIGLAHGVELGFTTTAEEISVPCITRWISHGRGISVLLCWHISTGASQNNKRRVDLEFNTSHQTSGWIGSNKKNPPNQTFGGRLMGWFYLITGERVLQVGNGGGGGDSLELVEERQWQPGF